jgi:hypothetical protein
MAAVTAGAAGAGVRGSRRAQPGWTVAEPWWTARRVRAARAGLSSGSSVAETLLPRHASGPAPARPREETNPTSWRSRSRRRRPRPRRGGRLPPSTNAPCRLTQARPIVAGGPDGRVAAPRLACDRTVPDVSDRGITCTRLRCWNPCGSGGVDGRLAREVAGLHVLDHRIDRMAALRNAPRPGGVPARCSTRSERRRCSGSW